MKFLSSFLALSLLLSACSTSVELDTNEETVETPNSEIEVAETSFKSTSLKYDANVWLLETEMLELYTDTFCWMDVSGGDFSSPTEGIDMTTQTEGAVTWYFWDDDLSYVSFPVGTETAYGSVSWGGDTEVCKQAFIDLAALNQ